MEKEKDNLSYRILRVKDIGFNVNENFILHDKQSSDIKISLSCELKIHTKSKIIVIEIFAFYYYQHEIGKQLASITVQNAFTVLNLEEYDTNDRLLLPPNFLITIVSISLSHTRALFSKNIDGTVFNGIIMPLINPEEFTKSVLPEMFNGTGLASRAKEIEEKLDQTGEVSEL